MAKSNEAYAELEQDRIDALNQYQRGERPFKICKGLGIDQGYGCENGLIAKVYLVSASGTGSLYS